MKKPEKHTFVMYDFHELMDFLVAEKLITEDEKDEWWGWVTDSDNIQNNSHWPVPLGFWGWCCAECGGNDSDERGRTIHLDPKCKCKTEAQTPPERCIGGYEPEDDDERERDACAFKVLTLLEQFQDKPGDLTVFMSYDD